MRGEVTLGQLCKGKYGKECFIIGQLTDSGTVLAADKWDGSHAVMRLNPGADNSLEHLCPGICTQVSAVVLVCLYLFVSSSFLYYGCMNYV